MRWRLRLPRGAVRLSAPTGLPRASTPARGRTPDVPPSPCSVVAASRAVSSWVGSSWEDRRQQAVAELTRAFEPVGQRCAVEPSVANEPVRRVVDEGIDAPRLQAVPRLPERRPKRVVLWIEVDGAAHHFACFLNDSVLVLGCPSSDTPKLVVERRLVFMRLTISAHAGDPERCLGRCLCRCRRISQWDTSLQDLRLPALHSSYLRFATCLRRTAVR